MNERLINDLYRLKDYLNNLELFKEIKDLDNKLNDSDEVKILSYKKDIAILNFEDKLKHYDKNSKEVLEEESNMAKAIYNLNNNELVKEYNKKFNEFDNLIKDINKYLFSFYED